MFRVGGLRYETEHVNDEETIKVLVRTKAYVSLKQWLKEQTAFQSDYKRWRNKRAA
jgi:hypothetical protein